MLAVTELLVTANIFPNSLILSTPMMETKRSSETMVLARATRLHIPKTAFFIVTAAGILHSINLLSSVAET
jgi:hypothetical protein